MMLSCWLEVVGRERSLLRRYFSRSASMRGRARVERGWWVEVRTEVGEESGARGGVLERFEGLGNGMDIVEAEVGVESLEQMMLAAEKMWRNGMVV